MPDRHRHLDGIRACVFDAYGTLFDLASATDDVLDSLGARAGELNALWRRKQLEYSWLRALMGRHADFERVTVEALDYSLNALGLGDNKETRAKLLNAFDRVRAYPEVPEVLRQLNEAGMPCAILSNGSPPMLEKGIERAGIGDRLEAVLSVERVGVFKPHPATYQLVIRQLGVGPLEVAFCSSNAWDVAGASCFGFRCLWINRSRAPLEHLPGGPEIVLDDLSPVPNCVLPA